MPLTRHRFLDSANTGLSSPLWLPPSSPAEVAAFQSNWPHTNTLTIKSLATGVPGQVPRVEPLGAGQTLHHLPNDQGLTINLPQHKTGDHAHAFKISGDCLV